MTRKDEPQPVMPTTSAPANDNGVDLLLAEVRLMREQMTALVQEIRQKKRTAAKRVRTLREKNANHPIAARRPTELQIARARRLLR